MIKKILTIVAVLSLLTSSSSYAAILPVVSGGTGTSTAPTVGQVPIGNGSGGYNYVASSTFGGSGGGTTIGTTTTSLNNIQFVPAIYTASGCAASTTANTYDKCVAALILSQVGIASGTTIMSTNNVLRSSWTGPININTNGLIVSLKCTAGVTLNYGGQGTAINFNFGNPIGHLVSDDSGCTYYGSPNPIAAGQTNTSTTTGIKFGGNNGSPGVDFHDNNVNGFGTQIEIGQHAYMLTIAHNSLSGGNGGQAATGSILQFDVSNDSGERNVIDGNNITDPGNDNATNSIYMANGSAASTFFTNNSIDDAQLRIGASDGEVVVSGNHFENAANNSFINTYGSYIPIENPTSDQYTEITLIGNEFANDPSGTGPGVGNGGFPEIIQHGAQLYAAGNHIDNYGGATINTFSDHNNDNGLESETICQTQAAGGTLTNIIGGNGNINYNLANGAACWNDSGNSYPIALVANGSNINKFYAGTTVTAQFENGGNWTLKNSLNVGSSTIQSGVPFAVSSPSNNAEYFKVNSAGGVAIGLGTDISAFSGDGLDIIGANGNDLNNVFENFSSTKGAFQFLEAASNFVGMRFVGTGSYWSFGENGSTNFELDDTTDSTAPFLIKQGAPTNSFVIASNGNIGIGSSTPSGKLAIQDNSGLAGTNILLTVASSTSSGLATTTLYQVLGNGHQLVGGTTPTVSGGTSAMVAPSNDNAGLIAVAGTALTSVTMTFAKPWATAPICTESDNVLATAADVSSISTTQVVFGFGTGGVTTANLWYRCTGTQ